MFFPPTQSHRNELFPDIEVDSLTEMFKKSRNSTRRSEVFQKNAKEHFYENYHKLHKLRHNAQQSSPGLALLKSIEKGNLQPKPLGLLKTQGSHVNLNFGISELYAGALSKGLREMKSLEKFEIKGNGLSKRGSLSILKSINSSSLKTLNFSGNKIDQAGIVRISSLITTPQSSLSIINLEGAEIRDKGAVMLCRSLEGNYSVKHLNLSKNALKEPTGIALKAMLKKNQSIKTLDLQWNSIYKTGANALFKGLQKNRTLTQLDLSWNGLNIDSSEMIDEMCGCLSKNKALSHLDISFNSLGTSECQRIGDALLDNHTLMGLHVVGNACEVDSLGFIKLCGQTQINRNPYSHRRILANEKNRPGENCWLCERWRDTTIKISSNEPVLFVHFSIDNFKAIPMSKEGNLWKFRRVLPPSENLIFFTDLSGKAYVSAFFPSRSKNLNIDVSHVDGLNVSIEKANVVYPKQNLRGKPRVPLPVYEPTPEEIGREPWDFNKSIFKHYVVDTPELLERCFEFDWSHSKLPKILKDPRTKELLRKHYAQIKNFYKMLSTSSFGEVFSVSQNTFFECLSNLGVLDQTYKAADFGVNWNSTLLNLDRSQLFNPGNSLVRYEFLEILVRVACDKYSRNNVQVTEYEAIEALLEELKAGILSANFNEFRKTYFCEEIDLLIKEHKRIFKIVYGKFSGRKTLPGKEKFMSIEEFRELCTLLGCCLEGSPTKDVDQAFCFAMITQVDELTQKRHMEMKIIEFYEAFARISDFYFRNENISLVEKMKKMIQLQIKLIMPRLIRRTSTQLS